MFLESLKIHRKTPVPETLLSKLVHLRRGKIPRLAITSIWVSEKTTVYRPLITNQFDQSIVMQIISKKFAVTVTRLPLIYFLLKDFNACRKKHLLIYTGITFHTFKAKYFNKFKQNFRTIFWVIFQLFKNRSWQNFGSNFSFIGTVNHVDE